MPEKPLRKTLELPIFDDTVEVDVDFRLIETVERVFGTVADIVAGDTLVHNPRRYQIAEVIASWVRSREHKRKDVHEHVITAPPERLQVYIGAIQGAVLYSLSYVSEDELDKLARGEDLDSSGEEDSDGGDPDDDGELNGDTDGNGDADDGGDTADSDDGDGSEDDGGWFDDGDDDLSVVGESTDDPEGADSSDDDSTATAGSSGSEDDFGWFDRWWR